MYDGYFTGPIKINTQAGNSAVIFGDATSSGSSIYYKGQGNAVAIGDPSSVFAPSSNGWMDSDVSDQNSGQSPTGASPVQS